MQQNFELNPKQLEALDLLIDKLITDLMVYGGSRSGKTFLLVWCIFIRASKCKSRHLILRDKFNHAKRAIWLDTIPKVLAIALPGLNPKPNKSDYYYTLPNGSEVWIGGLDSKERTEKILGTEYSTIYFNETSQIDYGSINIAKTRLAEKSDLIKKCYYDSNPPTKTSWQYQLFEKKLDPIDGAPVESPESYSSFLMNPQDNISNIDPGYLKILSKLPEKERNRFLLGLYNDESDGCVYYAFRRDQHVKEISKLPGTLFVGMDFNVNPMTAVIIQVINNKINVIDEIFLENSDTPKMCNELVKRGYSGARIIPDSTGRNRKTSGQSDFDIIKHAGFVIESTYNPYVKDRTNNVNRLFTEDKILISPKCRKLINDLERVSWRNNELDQKSEPMLTHISDAMGYACHKLMPYFKYDLTPGAKSR